MTREGAVAEARRVLERHMGESLRVVTPNPWEPGVAGRLSPEDHARLQAEIDAAVRPSPELRVVLDHDHDFLMTRELRYHLEPNDVLGLPTVHGVPFGGE